MSRQTEKVSYIKKKVEEMEPKSNINHMSNNNTLKAPVVCFLGHVDAGKTSLMDIIRDTSIQENESGGITQNIGSSFISIADIREKTTTIKGKFCVEHIIPGFLIIDTPGHQAFSSLRERGSSLCDLGILVIDIEEGLQPQTIESIKLLTSKKVPFVIAATKLDKIYNWEETNCLSLQNAFKKQTKDVVMTVVSYIDSIKYELKKEGVKSEFYSKNKKTNRVYSIIPVSSKTKEGLADLLSFLVYLSQNWMSGKITYQDKIKASIMNCHQDRNQGWVIDVILSNGTLNIGDKFAVAKKSGPHLFTVRNLLTQNTNSKLWIQHQSVRASAGVRILGSSLDNCYTGTRLYLAIDPKKALEKVDRELTDFWKVFNYNQNGIVLMAETLGELEACYNVFKEQSINVLDVKIGRLVDTDIGRVKLKLDGELKNENRVIIFFGDKTEKQKTELDKCAISHKIKLIISPVVYHLLEKYQEYKDKCLENRRVTLTNSGEAIFPCRLRILKQHIYMTGGSDDILMGVKVMKGILHKGTPLIVPGKNVVLGKVISIQKNHKELDKLESGKEACIRVNKDDYVSYGRHFDFKDIVVSHISRESIDILKDNFRDRMEKEDWMLVIELKKLLDIK